MKNESFPLNLIEPPLEGVNLIEASAGTGKTYAICAIFIHLLLEKSIPIEKILVVTFTVAATEELKGRIRTMMRKLSNVFQTKGVSGDDKDYELMQALLERYEAKPQAVDLLKTALRDFDRAAIFTIHGFCQRMLMENAFESSSLFDTELISDADALIEEASKDFWRRKMYTAGEALIRYAEMQGLTPRTLAALAKNRPLDPGLIILPESTPPDEMKIEEAYVQLKSLFNELQNMWDKSGKEICALIDKAREEKKLNGNKYRQDYMGGRIEEMNYFISENDVLSTKYEKILYFSTSRLNEKTNAITHPFCKKLDDFLNLRDSLLNDLAFYLMCLKKEFIHTIETFLSRYRHRKNARTFEDLLTGMFRALKGNSESPLAHRIRTRFHAALIDEFQDTDPLQYEIFSTVFRNHRPLYLIGDPKQAIYKFRGADIFAYLRASAQCDRKLTLSKNYRSHPDLVRAINTIFGNRESTFDRPFVIEGINYHPVEASLNERAIEIANTLPEGSPLTIWYIDNAQNDVNKGKAVTKADVEEIICTLIIKEISTLTKHGTNPGEIAVLVRKNDQSKLLARELRKHQIPCVTYGTESVLETDEAVEMERILSSIAEPANRGYLAAALATDFFGKTASEIAEIVTSEEKLSSRMEQFKRYREIWERHGFITMFRRLMQENKITSRLASLEDGERRLTNVFHIAELIHRAEREHRLGIDGILKWFSEEKSLESEEIKLRLETDEYAVKILTIHKSKGLEFPIVFAPFLYDSAELKSQEYIYHIDSNDKKITHTVLNLSGDEAEKQQALIEELSESVRLMYVALTRAKVRCYTLWGRINKAELAAPMYVFHHHRIPSPEEFINTKTIPWNDQSSDMLHDMRQLADQSKGAISVKVISEADLDTLGTGYAKTPERKSSPTLTCRTFTQYKNLQPPWSLTSFSSLIFNAKEEYREKADEEGGEEKQVKAKEFSIHTFPRGTRAGLFIHEVFENIDFQNPSSAESESLIKDLLRKYGIDENWTAVIRNNVSAVLSHPLESGTHAFRLAELNSAMRVHELEFYFPASKISPGKIADLIISNQTDKPGSIPPSLSRLGFEEIQGFVRGFIDLVFTVHGKWFLADWKSNHLGDSLESYTQEKLSSAMLEKYYYLQYHLYAVALHRHLERTLPGYEYDSHFGGIFYFFIRGIDSETSRTGLFFNRPSKHLIKALDDHLGRQTA